MEWYCALGSERKGPLSDEEFQRLVQQGVVTPQTLVWRDGLSDWQPYASQAPVALAPPPVAGTIPAGDTATCAGCAKTFSSSDVVPVGTGLFCAACKPLALQRLREGMSSTSAVEEIRREHLKHEASVKSVGFLYYLGGIAMVLAGTINIVLGFTLSGTAASGALFGLVVGGVIFILGAAQFWVAYGLRRLKPWARIPTAILSGIGLLGFPIGTIINGYIMYLVLCAKGKTVFSEEYRAVIAQTPHIKYRTSIVVWILLGLIVFIIAAAVVVFIFTKRSTPVGP